MKIHAFQSPHFFKFSLLVLTIFIFTSCDPGQILTIENQSKSVAKVMIIFNENIEHNMFGEGLESDTLRLELDPTNNTSKVEYYFGMGTWKIQSSLDELIGMVNTIEIDTWKSKQLYQGEEQIRMFFENKIAGRKKEIIKIILD